jgi:ribosomal-protein-alanine N-acetyltransferase
LRVRPTTREDVEALLAIESEVFTGAPYGPHRFERPQFEYYLGNEQAVTLVAERQGRPVGYALGIVSTGQRAGHARLHSIGVRKRFRGRGIGTALLRAFLARIRELGCDTTILEVAAENPGARALFEGVGFEVRECLEDYYGKGRDALRMRLPLAER